MHPVFSSDRTLLVDGEHLVHDDTIGKVQRQCSRPGPGMARGVYVSAPPASSATVTAGRRAQVKVPGECTREVTLDTGASADTPVRDQGPGRSLPGPDAGHPLQGAGISHGFLTD